MNRAEHVNKTKELSTSWYEENRIYLEDGLARLRYLLQRRVLWLRRQWQHDPLPNYQGMLISEDRADWLLAGEDHHAEKRFYQEDPEAKRISADLVELEEKLARRMEVLNKEGLSPALEVLVHLFGLTSFEKDVILLCLAPECDPAFERLYAYVQDDVNRKYATPHLALALFFQNVSLNDGGNNRADACFSFLPEAPLRRFRLVNLEPGPVTSTTWGGRPLRLDERLVGYLCGVNRLDERLTDFLKPLRPALLTPDHQNVVDDLARTIEAASSQRMGLMLNLIGPVGAGKRAVTRALGDHLKLHIFSLEASRLPSPGPDLQDLLRLLEREAILLQFALYLDPSDLGLTDPARTASIEEVIDRLGVFLVVGSRERWQTERKCLAMRVPKPDKASQHILWEQALVNSGQSVNGQISLLVQQFDFGPQNIVQAVAAAEDRARIRAWANDVCLTADDLWQSCRELAGWKLDELVQRITPCYSWEDIVLPDDVFRQLQEISAQVTHRAKVYEDWGFGAKLSRGRGISALFAGPSGTGKTMAVEVLANHLKLDLYRIDLAGVVSKYIGETEKNLKKVFDAAEQSGAILFFDEADALFGKRTEVKDSHDRYANIEVNYLLQRMEDYRGLAILATNRKSALDRAFLRRLRFLVDFPFPDAEDRRHIWQKVYPPQAVLEELDYSVLARMEIPGGNIRNIALNAGFLAADEEKAIDMPHVIHAARREYAKIDKQVSEAEFGAYYRLTKS